MSTNSNNTESTDTRAQMAGISRRGFLGLTGAALAAGALAPTGALLPRVAHAQEKQTITVAFLPDRYPVSYWDENNNPTGYEVEVVKAVAEKLADKYDYEWEGVDQTAVFAGLASGKYDQGLTNSFWTPERADKYLQPQENVGATILGIVVRSEDSDIRSLRDAAERGLKLAPILAGDGNYYVVQDYNDKNPDAQLDLQATDDTTASTQAFDWVAQGRYDLDLIPLQYYNALVVEESGTFHKYIDTLSFVVIGGTKTWSFFKKGDDAYAADWDAAVKELKAEGRLEELSRQWYGINNFAFVDDSQTYNFLDEAILVDPHDESNIVNYGKEDGAASPAASSAEDE